MRSAICEVSSREQAMVRSQKGGMEKKKGWALGDRMEECREKQEEREREKHNPA